MSQNFSISNDHDSSAKMNYSRFINAISAARKPSPIRELSALLTKASPSLIFLAAGQPNPGLFPFKAAEVTLQNGEVIKLSSNSMVKALQYGPSQGYPELITQLQDFQKKFHNPPRFDQLDLLVTTGAQDGLSKVFEMILSPGDYVIMQEPAYPGALAILNPYKPKYLVVDGDKDGIKPQSLRKVLHHWTPEQCRNDSCVAPRVIYINPNGANPAGTSMNFERKKEIYKIAQEYDLLILEDDPYYFLQFSDEFVPSFLSLDVDGRVLRFDSFSKILSSGMRVGFLTGPKVLIQRINYHVQSSNMHTSGLSQVLISELLKSWGFEGFTSHVKSVRAFYENQKQAMIKSAERWLKGLAEWDEPVAGMFLWIKVFDVEDTHDMIMKRAYSKNVLLVPGRHFLTDSSKPSPYMRAAFSLATPEKIDEGFQSLAAVIKEQQAAESSAKS